MVTDTAFKKSSLPKLCIEKRVPGTSKNWLYHKDLLVFCFRFKILPVCEYLNFQKTFKKHQYAPTRIHTKG